MKGVKTIVVSCVVSVVMSVPCMAQDVPAAEFSAGYNLLQLSGDGSETFPAGWYGELAGNFGSMLALVGQATGNYKGIAAARTTVDVSIHTFGGGVRLLARGEQATGFGHVLFGMAHTNFSSNASGLLPFDVGDSQNDAFLQVGAGFNLLPNASVGVRVGGDYVRILSNGGANVFRLAAGVVVPLGR